MPSDDRLTFPTPDDQAPSGAANPDPGPVLSSSPPPLVSGPGSPIEVTADGVQRVPLDRRWKGYDGDKPPEIRVCTVCHEQYETGKVGRFRKQCWKCLLYRVVDLSVAAEHRWKDVLKRLRKAGIREKLPANPDSLQEFRYGPYGIVMTTPRIDTAAELLGACCSLDIVAIMVSDPLGQVDPPPKVVRPRDLLELMKGEGNPQKFPLMRRFYMQRWDSLSIADGQLAVELAIEKAGDKIDIGDRLKYENQKVELMQQGLALSPVEDTADTNPEQKRRINRLVPMNDEAVEAAMKRIAESTFRSSHGLAPER